MAKTHLSLLFFDSPDPKSIYAQDVSMYNPDQETETPLLEVVPPNFSTKYTLIYPISKLIVLNSNSIGWTNTNNYDELTTLSDGLWEITQSVSPNGLIRKTHYYFRITKLKQSLITMVGNKMGAESVYCSPNDSWYTDVFDALSTLEVAKQLSELCCKHEEAKIMYNQVLLKSKQLDPYCNC